MRKIYFILLAVFILLAFKQDNAEFSSQKAKFKLPKGITEKDYLPNTLVVKFKSGLKRNATTQSLAQGYDSEDVLFTTVMPIFPQERNIKRSQVKDQNFDVESYYHIEYMGKANIEKVINTLLENEDIAYAEPRYINTVEYTPNDVAYSIQFYLPQVKAPEAWDVRKDATNVIIAIVDTGSELTHEDLAANIYYNIADPVNGIDDDGDGYIDNYAGWDFCGASASTMVPDNDPNVKSKGADHGVHVSGIAGAVSDNGLGVASVAYNPKLLIIKAGADDSPTSIYKGYEGIKYAADKGAHIINCSWGGVGGGQFGQEMINYAISKGCLVIAAAGNSKNDISIYPAAFEGVLAVANLNADDTKGSASNYGAYVDISAPGQGIYNTVYNNGYAYYSGTSMAAPLVASAAALLKAKYPNYTGLQIGELLRSTADNIDAKNPSYINLLGKGRLNVERALTENAASLRYQQMTINDQISGNRAAGSTIALQFMLKNFLQPITNLNVNISSNSAYVQVVDQNINVGNFNTLEVKNAIGPVRVKILPNTPENHQVTFTLRYTGNNGNYTNFENFSTVVALDYLNVVVNKISTTLTSNGRVGYSKADAKGGLGFVYKEESMLFEAALMVAKSETQVMNNARFDTNSSEDFQRQQTASIVVSNTAAFEGTSVFTDAANANPIGLKILSRVLAFNTAADDKYVIVEYEINNTSGADLKDIYTGLFTDWDLDESSSNATEYDVASKIAYVYAKKNAAYPYAAIKLLKAEAAPAYYPLSYQVPNSFLADNIFSVAEKYKSLTSGIQSLGLGYDTGNGLDVVFTLGSGPYDIPKDKSIKVAYAFLAGDQLNDLKSVANAAAEKYVEITTKPKVVVPEKYALQQNYPNAATTYTNIVIELPEKTNVSLNIYDITGKKTCEVSKGLLAAGRYNFYVDVSRFANGTYTYELKTPTYKKAKKMIVAR